jgi:SAM-dependent MidA family methyltransferase
VRPRKELTEKHGSAGVAERLRARIARHGPVPFSVFMDTALYDPDGGFYATGGRAGRRGDFLTSPEVGPLFGAVVARALDTWWDEQGRPRPFVVVDAGAGPGTLARAVLAAEPACASAMRYVLVERAAAQRVGHPEHLPLEPAVAAALGRPADADAAEGQPAGALLPTGPVIMSLAELPSVPAHVIVANELLDNLAVDVLEGHDDRWHEVLVGHDGERFVEVLVPAPAELDPWARRTVPAAPPGARIPVHAAAQRWLADALERLAPGGRLVVLDFAATTAGLATRPWLRTYRGHERGGDPLVDPGGRDLTVDVALDQLAAVRQPTRMSTQAEFLAAHGIAALVAEGKQRWAERAHVGDLAALAARSRVAEAAALTDPDGLGAFTVVEWIQP